MTESKPHHGFVAIGASGSQGLQDIKELVAALPMGLNAVVMVVLHRRWDKLSNLRAVLAEASHMPIVIASDGQGLEPGTVYIGEPSEHLTLVAKSFGKLVPDDQRDFTNRTIDLLFKSVAAFGGPRAIGVVLSGSLDDGSRGLAAIHAAGGVTMVLTATTGEQGMPENAADYDGPIDVIGSPQVIAKAIRDALQ